MCNVCCKEFRGWCKSFTRTEALLSLLEAFLLLVFIGFLIFLILHLIVCYKPDNSDGIIPVTQTVTTPYFESENRKQTLSSDVQCTWEPSKKTEATTHYYENAPPGRSTAKMRPNQTASKNHYAPEIVKHDEITVPVGMEDSDGEEVEQGVDNFLLALVKMHPMRESTFGCVLTAVSHHWALTAASCIEAVEEVDSLDAFVMLEGYSTDAGVKHAVADVRVHPEYVRAGHSRDLAALRSQDALAAGPLGMLRLPTALDHLFITIGERLTVIGYGKFRTPEKNTPGRAVREVPVYTLPGEACAGADGGAAAWAPRHLARGGPMLPATGAIGPLCAGPLYARGVACNYCAGTPLLRARVVLGVMADSARCGAACEPAPYASLAAVRPWLDDLLAAIIV